MTKFGQTKMTYGQEQEYHRFSLAPAEHGMTTFRSFPDHFVLFRSPFMRWQFEKQGRSSTAWGTLESITEFHGGLQTVSSSVEDSARKIAVLQNACVWTALLDYVRCTVDEKKATLVTTRCKYLPALKRKKEIPFTKSLLPHLQRHTMYGFKFFYDDIVYRDVFAAAYGSIWGKSKAQENRQSLKIYFDDDEVLKKVRCVAAKDPASDSKGATGTQITMTYDLRYIHELFRKPEVLGIEQSNLKMRRTQLKNAAKFAEDTLRALYKESQPNARGALASLSNKRRHAKLLGFLSLLYLQLHGFEEPGVLGGGSKVWVTFSDRADINASVKSSYQKDWFGLLLKTPLREIYLRTLSQNDRALLLAMGARDYLLNHVEALAKYACHTEGGVQIRRTIQVPKKGGGSMNRQELTELVCAGDTRLKAYIKHVLSPHQNMGQERHLANQMLKSEHQLTAKACSSNPFDDVSDFCEETKLDQLPKELQQEIASWQQRTTNQWREDTICDTPNSPIYQEDKGADGTKRLRVALEIRQIGLATEFEKSWGVSAIGITKHSNRMLAAYKRMEESHRQAEKTYASGKRKKNWLI